MLNQSLTVLFADQFTTRICARAATTMRGFFGNCAMRDAGDLGKIVRQNLPNMRCYAGCREKNYQYKN